MRSGTNKNVKHVKTWKVYYVANDAACCQANGNVKGMR